MTSMLVATTTTMTHHKRSRSLTTDIKTLCDKRSRFERSILKLSGAARLAESQFAAVIEGAECSLCGNGTTPQTSLPSSQTSEPQGPQGSERATAMERMRRTFDICESSVELYLSKHRACINELSMLTGMSEAESCKARMHSDEWCSSEFKRGKLATLREQKTQSLRNRECVVCGCHLDNFAQFLSKVDRQVTRLESELHAHK